MPSVKTVTLTGNSVDKAFNFIGNKGNVFNFRHVPAGKTILDASHMSAANTELPDSQRTRVTFKVKSPVTQSVDGVDTVVAHNEVDVSFRLSYLSTAEDRKAIREQLVDLLGETDVATQIDQLESWF